MGLVQRARERGAAVAASVLATAAGGALDAWVYLAHGHTFATAQTGNVILMMIALINGEFTPAISHLTSLLAFVAGLFSSRQSDSLLTKTGRNSRGIRLGIECALLSVLGLVANHLSDPIVIACVGFIAGVQITSLSHIGTWSFNTGMTTGNLREAVSALSKALAGSEEEWAHASVMGALCAAFGAGALAGAWLTPRMGELTLLPVAALILATIAVVPRGLNSIPDWKNL